MCVVLVARKCSDTPCCVTTGPLNLCVDPMSFLFVFFFADEGKHQRNAGVLVPHLLSKPPLVYGGECPSLSAVICNCDSQPQVQQLRVGLWEFNG